MKKTQKSFNTPSKKLNKYKALKKISKNVEREKTVKLKLPSYPAV